MYRLYIYICIIYIIFIYMYTHDILRTECLLNVSGCLSAEPKVAPKASGARMGSSMEVDMPIQDGVPQL